MARICVYQIDTGRVINVVIDSDMTLSEILQQYPGCNARRDDRALIWWQWDGSVFHPAAPSRREAIEGDLDYRDITGQLLAASPDDINTLVSAADLEGLRRLVRGLLKIISARVL